MEDNKDSDIVCDPPNSNLEIVNNTAESNNISETVAVKALEVAETFDDCKAEVDLKEALKGSCEAVDEVRCLGDLEQPAADDLALGAAGSDSGVEGCGRALSSAGGSRSCASSVVSCGSGCGSESSSLAGAPSKPRRRVNVTVQEPKRSSPVGSSSSRPATAPRGPNLATRERARSREKPTPPEKPRPLTPKPRIRPTSDLPNLVRESPALRAKPTKTSTARCRTPNSPIDEKKWPTNGHSQRLQANDASATRIAADKYGTLPRRRRDADQDSSPKHESVPRRPTITRSVSSRSATKARVKIYAEKTSQTVLGGADIEAALAGFVPNIESRAVSRCDRGVQAGCRDGEAARVCAAQAAAAEQRERRTLLEEQLQHERAARRAAAAQLERNTQRLLELAGDGAGAGADGCLRALEEQLRSARELSTRQRVEIDSLRDHCDKLHAELCHVREAGRVVSARLLEVELEGAEMQDFLAAETGALGDSLREADDEVARLRAELERSRGECRLLVRSCERGRQEALAAAARARRGAGHALTHTLTTLTHHLHAHTHADHSRSDSGSTQSPEEEPRGLLGALARALLSASSVSPPPGPPPGPLPGPPTQPEDEPSRLSDDNDNSADLLDSETEPCLVTDPVSWSVWDRESVCKLSAAICRQRLEADLLHTTTRDTIQVSEKNVAEDVVKKIAELEACKNLIEEYKQNIEVLKSQVVHRREDPVPMQVLEREQSQPSCGRPQSLQTHDTTACN